MTGPKPLAKWALHTVWYRASSFKWEYPLLSLRSSNSFLRLLPCLPVTSIPPCIFPSITHCRRQFLCKMWPIQFAFRLRISCRIFLCSLTLSNTSSFITWSVQLIFFFYYKECVYVCVSACACVSEFWGFQGGVDEDSRLLAYDAWSTGDWILIFQSNVGPITPWSLGHYIAAKDWDPMTHWRTVITPKNKILNSVHSWFWHTTLYSWNGVICQKMTAAKCFNSVLCLHITVMECILLSPRNN